MYDIIGLGEVDGHKEFVQMTERPVSFSDAKQIRDAMSPLVEAKIINHDKVNIAIQMNNKLI